MNTLLLQPNDVLFFKDGRPMSGGLAGHGAAWPLPTVTSAALHAALWRAGLADASHPHRPGRNGKPNTDARTRRFGSLLTAGPFPAKPSAGSVGEWFFPRPADAQAVPGADAIIITLQPVPLARSAGEWSSSLPSFLTHAAASTREPTKDKPEQWWSRRAFETYLKTCSNTPPDADDFRNDDDIFLAEHTVGIGMDAVTGTQDGERIYSAHYLRLRDVWRLGLLTKCDDKKGGDLLGNLFQQEKHILVGGQQRACTVEGPSRAPVLPLPRGRTAFTPDAEGKCRVKWVLLTPAVWPEIPSETPDGRPMNPHPGGWLPNWVFAEWNPEIQEFNPRNVGNGEVLLTDGPGKQKSARTKTPAGKRIQARLVAAVVPKAIPVTGYALPNEDAGTDGGAKPTHLAVPAGAVYYFETVNGDGRTAEQHAANLAAALNWHGAAGVTGQPDLSRIKNRRSTLFGEKGFGLGVCGAWTPLASPPA